MKNEVEPRRSGDVLVWSSGEELLESTVQSELDPRFEARGREIERPRLGKGWRWLLPIAMESSVEVFPLSTTLRITHVSNARRLTPEYVLGAVYTKGESVVFDVGKESGPAEVVIEYGNVIQVWQPPSVGVRHQLDTFSLSQAAEFLGCSFENVRQQVGKGNLDGFKEGGRWRVVRSAVIERAQNSTQ